jgi:hypothetical protein
LIIGIEPRYPNRVPIIALGLHTKNYQEYFCCKKILELEGKNCSKNEQFLVKFFTILFLVKVGTKTIKGIFNLNINYVIQVDC